MVRMVAVRLLAALVLMAAMFFLPAGTFAYWEPWVYLAILFVPMFLVAVIPSLLIIPILVARICNEESVMLAGLKGYREYMQQTRYRLLPGIW